ncbi:MAG: glycosyltransferase [Bacteroidaceae bacterium]|nr:glycosyltransferase [Bacteroidaceae bacterium]
MISVCIATYYGEKYIHEQIASILSQLSPEDEVVISDDHSTDETILQLHKINDKRIRIVEHETLREAKFVIDHSTANFVNAMRHAHGDIIFLSDQDDVWLPGKVQKMKQALETYDLVKSDCSVTDANLNIISPSYCALHPFKPSILSQFIRPTFTGSCMAFKRKVYEKALPFPKHGVAHDLWLGFVALKFFKVGFINEPLMLYRRHNATVTESAKGEGTSLLFKLHYRFYVAKALFTLLFCK